MNLVKLALKLTVRTPQVESFDRYLFIGPHPDDIEIGAGATVAGLVKKHKTVTFLICTDGRFGDGASGDIKGDALALLRQEEAVKSARMLGVTDVRFLNLKDGAGYKYSELVKKIAEVVSDVKPDIIFAPDDLSKSECHPDHLRVGKAARTIACFSPYQTLMQERFGVSGAPVKALALYMTARPNRYVDVKGLLARQLKALFECHKSQYPQGSAEARSIMLYLTLRYIQYGGREGFRVYSQTHMHCLPEAE